MKKLISLILAAMLLLTLVACNGTTNSSAPADSSDSAASSQLQSETPTLNTVTPGKLTMATDAGFAPYEYVEGERLWELTQTLRRQSPIITAWSW